MYNRLFGSTSGQEMQLFHRQLTFRPKQVLRYVILRIAKSEQERGQQKGVMGREDIIIS